MAVPAPPRPSRPRQPRPAAAKQPPPTLVEVGATGDRRATLEALRQHVLRLILDPATPALAVASLTSRAQSLLDQIDAIPVAKESNPVNEIAARAARKRRAAAAG